MELKNITLKYPNKLYSFDNKSYMLTYCTQWESLLGFIQQAFNNIQNNSVHFLWCQMFSIDVYSNLIFNNIPRAEIDANTFKITVTPPNSSQQPVVKK